MMHDTGVRVFHKDGLFHVGLDMGDGSMQPVTMNLDGSSKGGTLTEIMPTLVSWIKMAAMPARAIKMTLKEEP